MNENQTNKQNPDINGFEHFMLKEIFEQPGVIKNIISDYANNKLFNSSNSFSKEELQSIDKIYIVACGTALHAGQSGKFAIEKFTNIPVLTDIASEFRYNNSFVDEKTLLIVISQSGETADTLGALEKGIKAKAKTLSITNVENSTIAKTTDKSLYCNAGPEVSIASTKAYTAQVALLYLLSLDMAKKLKTIDDEDLNSILIELKKLPEKIEEILQNVDTIKNIANELKECQSMFYIGRGPDLITAKEGSLKLKETSYIHSEPFAAGELKHGTMALMDSSSKVIAVATQSNLSKKTANNVLELREKGVSVYSIGVEGDALLEKNSNYTIFIPKSLDILSPILTVIPEQLIAYYTSLAKGIDVDHPRNLTKSVISE